MFCKKCGSNLEEGMKFCSVCGENLENTPDFSPPTFTPPPAPQVTQPTFTPPPAPQVTQPTTVAQQNPVQPNYAQPNYAPVQPNYVQPSPVQPNYAQPSPVQPVPSIKGKPNGKLIGIIIGVALVVIIGAFFVFSGGLDSNDPETVLKKYITASLEQDGNTISKYSAYDVDALIEEMYKAQGLSKKDFEDELYKEEGVKSLKKLFDKKAKEKIADLKEEYGNNYKISIEILSSTEMKNSELTDEIKYLKNGLRGFTTSTIIDFDNITEMVEYKIEYTIEGSEDKTTENGSLTLLKINGKWRTYEAMSSVLDF